VAEDRRNSDWEWSSGIFAALAVDLAGMLPEGHRSLHRFRGDDRIRVDADAASAQRDRAGVGDLPRDGACAGDQDPTGSAAPNSPSNFTVAVQAGLSLSSALAAVSAESFGGAAPLTVKAEPGSASKTAPIAGLIASIAHDWPTPE